MKRFSKIAMSVATVSAMAAAMAISASAMTAEYTAPTEKAPGTVNLTGVEATGAHQTVLVLNAVNLQEIAEGNIVQIDQKDDGTSFVSVPVGELTKGTTYEVRIGGNGTVQTDTFTVGGSSGKKTIMIGDINEDADVSDKDATEILKWCSSIDTDHNTWVFDTYKTVGDELLAADYIIYIGDINEDGDVTDKDATEILKWCSSIDTEENFWIMDEHEAVYIPEE